MPGVFIGPVEITDVGDITIGTTSITEIYVGGTKVWPVSSGLTELWSWDPENDEALPGGETFTRASIAQEFDGTDFTQVGANAIRDDSALAGAGPQGFLAEPDDTNNVLDSSDFNDPSWTQNGLASVVDDGTNIIGLQQHTLTADTSFDFHRVVAVANVSGRTAYAIAKNGGSNPTRYLIVRIGSSSSDYVCFDLQDGLVTQEGSTASGTIVPLGNDFYQCEAAGDSLVTSFYSIVLSDRPNPGTANHQFTGASETVLLCHADAADTEFVTTPILTSGTAQSRSAEVLDTGVVIASEFGLLLDVTLPRVVGVGNTITLMGPSTTAEDIIRVDENFDVIMDDGGTPVTIGTSVSGARIRLSYGRDASGRSASLDGATAVTGGAPGSGHEGENFELGSRAGINQSRCSHHLTTIYAERPSDAELETLSTPP